jgi:hypothetical protein
MNLTARPHDQPSDAQPRPSPDGFHAYLIIQQRIAQMVSRRRLVSLGALAGLFLATGQAASAQDNKNSESKMQLFKVTTVKDEIIIGLSADELKAVGGNDAGAVAHALAQKGDMTVWQYNVHRGATGELVQSPTAKIGLLANASLRVEPYATTYTIVPHE